MSGSAPFRLNRSGLLLALISAGFAGQAAGAAARVDFTVGSVTATGQDGRARALAKGAELDSGDTVRTNDGRVQLRFSDGSYVSLQPNTDFAISEYKFDGKDDDRGFFGLLKGAMRTVTGAVGRVNRNSYRITTPTATVGIRGTGGVIQVLNDGSTLVIGTSGIWSLTNPAGSIDIPAGISGLAPREPSTPPHETNTQPQTRPADVPPPKDLDYKSGEDVNDDGQPIDVVDATGGTLPKATFVPLLTGSGYQIAAVYQDPTGAPTMSAGAGYVANFDATGALTQFKPSSGSPVVGIGSGSQADFGSDGILAWGRWTGTVNLNGTPMTYSPDQGLHYVVGMPTAMMPTAGSATYSLIGASRPTYMAGNTAPGTVTGGTLTATFASTFVNLNLSGFTVAMPDRTYVMAGSGCGSGSAFALSTSVTGCFSGCSGTVQGFFAGASAERVGMAYHISDSPNNVAGAAAFSK
jgi:hypothetical protein